MQWQHREWVFFSNLSIDRIISINFLFRISLCSQLAITPVVIQALANRGLFHRAPWANAPIQTGLVGFVLIFATPLGCAFFSQMASIKVDDLEGNVRDIVHKKNPDLQVAWYNKGL